MSIQPFKKVRSEDDLLRKIQDNVEVPLRDISSRPILDGRMVEDIELIAYLDPPLNTLPKQTFIQHKLQRKLLGWIIIKQNAQADIWEVESTRPQDNLVLRTSADCKISLWVF